LINTAYSQALDCTGYPAASSWTLSPAGSLPLGLSLDTSTGVISGTPSATSRGTYTFTVTASNSAASTAAKTFTMTVRAPLAPAAAINIINFGTWNGVGTASATITGTGSMPGFDFIDFVDLAVADSYTLLRPNIDYIATQGSTIITFTTAYLNKLSNGTYYYIAEYTNYDTQNIRLIVNKPANHSVAGNAGEGGEGGLAATGDDPYMLFLTTLLAIVSALCLFMLTLYYRLAFRNSKPRKY